VCAVVCFAGLYRLGELCSTTTKPFDPSIDVSETDLHFLPSFWDADRVEIHVGPSKADRSGQKARANQRVLPLDPSDPMSPGVLLRQLLVRRHHLLPGALPPTTRAPLFQDHLRRQLKSRTVVDYMRSVLRDLHVAPATVARCPGHSFRIGGATRLFQLQAAPEVLKRLGGWSSQACSTHVHVRQQDLMEFSRCTCK
jgi:hypothetical protein